MPSEYYTAAICRNGHPATSAEELYQTGAGNFCQTCGARLIRRCEKCSTSIRGYPKGVFSTAEYKPPAYCYDCGEPFAWTAEKLSAAKEIADELEGLTDDERTKLKEALDDVTREGPRNELGASRIKKLLTKAGGDLGTALWKGAIEVASETAKKILTTGQLPF